MESYIDEAELELYTDEAIQQVNRVADMLNEIEAAVDMETRINRLLQVLPIIEGSAMMKSCKDFKCTLYVKMRQWICAIQRSSELQNAVKQAAINRILKTLLLIYYDGYVGAPFDMSRRTYMEYHAILPVELLTGRIQPEELDNEYLVMETDQDNVNILCSMY
jgi:hypothetical protein